MYTIIEDCSPYYIKFEYPGLEEFIKKSKLELSKINITDNQNPVFQRKLAREEGLNLLNLLPYKDKFVLQDERVAYIITDGGHRHYVHIDKASVSFNYGISIADELCKTSWYDSKNIEERYSILSDDYNRAIVNNNEFLLKSLDPIKTFTQKEGECILFNTDIYHDFDNRESKNKRALLTFRPKLSQHTTFKDAKRILFGLL
jgi:hypothetical protein